MKKQNLSPQQIQQLEQQFQTALKLHQSGSLQQAHQLYLHILQLVPNHAGANQFAGVIAHQSGDNKTAEKLIKKAIKANPNSAQAHNHLGVVLQAQGKANDARSSFYKATKLQPDYAEAYVNLGMAYRQLEQLDKAQESIQKAVKLNPGRADSYNALGMILRARRNLTGSIESYKKAIEINPRLPEAYTNLGNTYLEHEDEQNAIECLQRATKVFPDYAEAHFTLGLTFQRIGQLDQAETHLTKAVELKADNLEFLSTLGVNHQIKGNYDAAYSIFEQVLAADPNDLRTRSSQLLLLNYSEQYSCDEVFRAHVKFEAELLNHKSGIKPFTSHKRNRQNSPRLRIGYVSPDFRTHSVAYFFETLLEKHDRSQFEIYCYYNNSVQDSVTKRLKSLSDHWCDCLELNNKALANRIHKDQIDILVDLAGHTAGHRLGTFAYKPAPVQMTWLGYPNTTGMRSIDYRLTDEFADPINTSDQYYTEKLIRLPRSFLCYQGDSSLPYSPTPSFQEKGYITFGSFNNLTKITDDVLQCWAAILKNVPDSRLLMKCKQLAAADLQARILDLFKAEGIEEQRIIFKAKIKDYQEHMSLYNQVDIGLDPFPYNGTTTTFEALWMGVPTLTLTGDRHASRVGTSIMNNIGLAEFACHDQESYIKQAQYFSENPNEIEKIRKELREKMQASFLCNGGAFAKDVERAYLELFESIK